MLQVVKRAKNHKNMLKENPPQIEVVAGLFINEIEKKSKFPSPK